MRQAAKFCLPAAGFLSLMGLTGCGGSDSGTNTGAPILGTNSITATLPDGLTAGLLEDKISTSVGSTVTYTLTLANSTSLPITYQPVYDGSSLVNVPASLSVKNPSGSVVFPVGAKPQLITVGPSVTLVPGQSVSGTQSVSSGYSNPGEYNASAVFVIQSGTASSSQTATVVGPIKVEVQ